MTNLINTRLLEVASNLPAEQASSLLDFAEFLLARYGAAESSNSVVTTPVITAPLKFPRPPEESVVGAIKRLRATYPMLDARAMLNKTSDLLTQHIVQGRDAVVVIDDLEILFRSHYEQIEKEN